jgi:peroxiredoxin
VSGFHRLPDDLPAPEDDGAADHLPGRELPDLSLQSTIGGAMGLTTLGEGLLVAYLYPRTGVPGRPLPEGWDEIPGARGCTPQSCAYRDALAEFDAIGATLVGISAQTPDEQAEFADREQIPFALLSDPDLLLAAALGLPTFEVEGMTLYRRLTLVVERRRIVKAFYPVFPPDRDAGEVLAWLRHEGRRGTGS